MFKRKVNRHRELHLEAAAGDREALKTLLTSVKVDGEFLQAWNIISDPAARDGLYFLYRRFTNPVNWHYSLVPHYERLLELALDATTRFIDDSVTVTSYEYSNQARMISDGLCELESLNKEVWARETDHQDVAGQVLAVLDHAKHSSLGEAKGLAG